MDTHHPDRRPSDESLVVASSEHIPVHKRILPCSICNETGISTIETVDRAGRKRGGVVIAMGHHASDFGVATVSTIEEATAIMALIQLAIDDAERIERGEAPLAAEGLPRKDN